MYCKTLYLTGLYFRVNTQADRDMNIKSWPIISDVRIIEQDMKRLLEGTV